MRNLQCTGFEFSLRLNVKHYLSICAEGAPLIGMNVTESRDSFHFLGSFKLTRSGCGA